MLAKELVAASTVPLLLSVLAEGESHGCALIQHARKRSDSEIQRNEGMLHPVFHWMEAEGRVASQWRQADSGRRKQYRLQPHGRQSLRREKTQWLTLHRTPTHFLLWPIPIVWWLRRARDSSQPVPP